jgi:predicted phage-related endonuclease
MVGKVTRNDQASASMLPALMGLSLWQSPNDCLMRAIGAMKGEPPPEFKAEAADWGNVMERHILTEACLRLGLENLDLDYTTAFQHKTLPLACSLDGTADGAGKVIKHDPDAGIYVMDGDDITLEGMGVLEAKLTAIEPQDSPPLYQGPIQLQAQMDILEAKWGAVCTLYRGTKLRIYLFKPHQPTLDAIAYHVREFQAKLDKWEDTATVDYYPPKDSEDAQRTWGKADEDAPPVTLPEEAEQLADNILNLKAEIKRMEELITGTEENPGLEAKLKKMLMEHTTGIAGRYKITWPMRRYKAQPQRVVPAKEASTIRQSTLTIKEIK